MTKTVARKTTHVQHLLVLEYWTNLTVVAACLV